MRLDLAMPALTPVALVPIALMPVALAPIALAAVALAAPSPAQDPLPRVDPAPFEFATTVRETGFPFGYRDRTRLRYLQVHDGLQGDARTINALSIRRAPRDVHTLPAFTAEVALRLSTARTTATTIAATFADNVGADAALVLPRRTVSFPETAGPYEGGGPAPFDFVLPADVPFAFGGRGPLCVDLRLFDHTNRAAAGARFALYAEGITHRAAFGTACGGLDLATTLTPLLATHVLTGAPADAPVLLLFGLGFDTIAGQPLPFDLTPLGAPDCALFLEPFGDVRGFADATGSFTLQIPVDTAPPGAFYGVQGITVEPGLNALGAWFSQANLALPVAGRILGRVWAEDPGATTGLRQPVFGLVIDVR